MKKSIRDLKVGLYRRLKSPARVTDHFTLTVEVAIDDLNHRPRHSLNGHTACAVFNDDTQRQRQTIFRLLLARFGAMIGKTTNDNHPCPATLW